MIESRGRRRVVLRVRVQPRASRDALAGEREGALVVRLTAPPVEGEANEALARLLAGPSACPRRPCRSSRGARRPRQACARGGRRRPRCGRASKRYAPAGMTTADLLVRNVGRLVHPRGPGARAPAPPCATAVIVDSAALAAAAGGSPGRGPERERAPRGIVAPGAHRSWTRGAPPWCPASWTPTPTWPSRATATTRSARRLAGATYAEIAAARGRHRQDRRRDPRRHAGRPGRGSSPLASTRCCSAAPPPRR